MLVTLPQFDYFSCKTIEEACSLLLKYKGEAQVLAGGTDLLVKMKHKKMLPRYLINIKKIPDLSYIHYDDHGGLRLGALTTMQAIKNSPLITKKFLVLNQAAGILGTSQIRYLATLGGNLCNASPAAECAPALLTLEARAKIVGLRGERTVPIDQFFTGPGESILERDEILTEIQVPNLPAQTEGIYLKHSTRRVDVAIVSVAVLITMDGQTCQDIKIALGAVGPTPFRARKAESIIRGQKLNGELDKILEKVTEVASEESFPITDIRGYADYRKKMVETLVRQGLERVIAQIRS